MIWRCMLWLVTRIAYRITGNVTVEVYVQILDNQLQDGLTKHGRGANEVTSRQENNPENTSKIATKYFNYGLEVIIWPAHFYTLIKLGATVDTRRED